MATESCAASWQKTFESYPPFERLVALGWLLQNPEARPADYRLEDALACDYQSAIKSWSKDYLRNALQTAGVFGVINYDKTGEIPGSENILGNLGLTYPAWIAFYLWFAHDDSVSWRENSRTRLVNDIGVLYETGGKGKLFGRFRLTVLPAVNDEVVSIFDDTQRIRFSLPGSCSGLFEASTPVEELFDRAHIVVRDRGNKEGLKGIVEEQDKHHAIPNTLVISISETVLKAVNGSGSTVASMG